MKKSIFTSLRICFILCSALLVSSSKKQSGVSINQHCNSHCSHAHVENNNPSKWIDCKLDEGASHYMTYIKSYEKQTVDGVLDIVVIMEAEDTSYIGNVFTFEAQGSFFSGTGVLHTSHDSLMPGDTLMFNFSVSYNKDSLPFYPEDLYFTVTDSLNGDTTRRLFTTRAKVYFTPWNTAEVWDFDDFHGQKRVWLAKEGNPQRMTFAKSSLPVSDITLEEFANDSIVSQNLITLKTKHQTNYKLKSKKTINK